MKNIVLFDIDNCISSDSWRLYTIIPDCKDNDKKYKEYHTLAPFDAPNHANVAILTKHFREGREVVLVTSRPEWIRRATDLWLFSHGIKHDKLLMRPEGDYKRSKDLKPFLLKQNGIDPANVLCAYDDRADVLEAYAALGIDAKKLCIHDTIK